MFVYVDIKFLRQHLTILQDELKETDIILEILMAMYQTAKESEIFFHQIQFIKKERDNILERMQILENSIEKFTKLDINIGNNLEEAIEQLKVYDIFR